MANPQEFARRIRKIGNDVEINSVQLKKNVVQAVGTRLILNTPILSGKARRNWIAQVGSAATEELPAPATPQAGEQEALSRLVQVVSGLKSGDTAHITNNVPYMDALNSGSSVQAPAMFVEASIQEAILIIRQARLIKKS